MVGTVPWAMAPKVMPRNQVGDHQAGTGRFTWRKTLPTSRKCVRLAEVMPPVKPLSWGGGGAYSLQLQITIS